MGSCCCCCVYLSTPIAGGGSRGLPGPEQSAGGTAGAELFPADKIKNTCVAAPACGRHGAPGSSNCLLLLSLQAY